MKQVILFVSAIIFLASCGKDGPIGPQGPQGPTGPGAISSGYDSVASWTLSSDQSHWYADIIDNDISSNVIDNGAVIAYWVTANSNGTYLQALPYTTTNFSELYYVSTGYVEIQDFNNSTTVQPLPSEYKIVVVSASVIKANPNVNFKNITYENLQKLISVAPNNEGTSLQGAAVFNNKGSSKN